MFEVLGHGVRLAFIDERPAPGDCGEPILLIHGFASTHAVNWVFPQWVKTLTKAGRRVIAFDNRGHGRSEKFYAGLPLALAEAMEAPSLAGLVDPTQRTFRAFAEATNSDLKALAACARGARQVLSEVEAGEIDLPVLIAAGTKDEVAGDPHELAALFRRARAVDIPGRDHNRAVGDTVYKQSVLEFLEQRP